MKRFAFLKFAVLALLAGSAGLPRAQAATGKFVYYMNYADTPSGTHYQMYVINADGTGNTRITHPDTDDLYPALSPDGTQIAYRTGYQGGIRLTNLSGTTLTVIPNTDDCTYPVWSPDGKKIAALGTDAGGSTAYVTINVDGTNRITRALGDSAYNYGGVVGWSPDGTKLVYTDEIYTGVSSQPAVYIANADGTGTPTKLTSDDNSEYTNASWSPDGTRILVQKRGAAYGFFLLDPNTGAETPVGSPVVAGEHPTWSPDGKQIAFESEADNSYGDIGIVNADGTNFHSIHTIGQANFVQWSAAGATTGGGTTAGAPVITSTQIGPITVGQRYDAFLTTDGKVPVAKFAMDAIPPGLSLNTGTGELFGTVLAADVPIYTSITVTVTSTAGVSASKDLPLTFSTAAPAAFSVSLDKPSDHASVIAGTAIKAKAKVDLTNAGTETVASLIFQLDGQPVGATLTAKPYKAIIPLDGSLSGTHSLTAVATANDGRTATSAPLTINVDARFVDLAGSATLKPKTGADGKVTLKGQYSLSNLGNMAAGPFHIGFYLSSDAVFDSTDVSLSALAIQLVGKDPGFDLTIPGLPANTTITSTDVGTILPKLKLAFPSTLLPLLTRYSGKYILGVVDPDNTAGEDASTRANNVIVYQLP